MITRKFDRRIACFAAAALVSLGGTAALAATTLSLTFQTTTSQTCTISAGSGGTTMTLDNNNYNPATTPAAITTSTMLSVTCTAGSTGVTVNLDAGANASGGERRMQNQTASSHYLSYKLYYDNGTNEWTSSTSPTITIPPDGSAVPLPVYAAIDPGQSLFVGTYKDTVGATVNF